MCQSCGVTILEPVAGEYCTDCFSGGAFSEPDLTQDDMIRRATLRYVSTRNMLEYQAKQRAADLIPTLKRWQS